MSFGMLKKTSRILMEGKPLGLNLSDVISAMEYTEGVISVHHLHVWELDESHRAMEAHIVANASPGDLHASELRAQLKSLLAERFDIVHSTLEVENPNDSCNEECMVNHI